MSADGQRPLLVVGHGPRSQPALAIARAASDLCEILWLTDESDPDNAVSSRLLRKFGSVVNTGGLSVQQIASLLRERSPAGIVAYRDDDLVPFSLLAEQLGLDYHSPTVARRLTDKFLQREALRRGGVPSPLCWAVPTERSRAALEAFAAIVEYPAVMKPRSGSGSRYAMLVADPGDLVRSIALCPPQAAGETGMLVEQYLPGLETKPSEHFADFLSVESLVAAGEINHLALNGRFPLAEPFRETGTFIPAALPQAQQTAVLDVATAALRALEVGAGGFHTEIKLTPDGPRVIEVNGRLGGGVPEMLFQASGVSLFELSMRIALGEAVAIDGPVPCTRVGWRMMFQPPMWARRVVSVEGLDRLAKLSGVSAIFLNRAPGDSIDWRVGTGHYVYEVTGVSEDHDGLLEINRFLHEEVSIVYE